MKPQIQTKIYRAMMKMEWTLLKVARIPKIKGHSIRRLRRKATQTMLKVLILYQIAQMQESLINLLKKICRGNIVVIIGRKSSEGNKNLNKSYNIIVILIFRILNI